MWTPVARVQLARGTIPSATSLADAEWALVQPFMPPAGQTGRPRRWPMRLILDAILYGLRTGCAWAHLPLDFPPPGTAHRWFLRLARSGIFERLAHAVALPTASMSRAKPLPQPLSWMRSLHAPAVSVWPVHGAMTPPSAWSAASGLPWLIWMAGS